MSSRLSKRLIANAASVPHGWPTPNLLAQKRMFVKKVVFDFDGPIVDFNTAFLDYLTRLYELDKKGIKLDASMLDHYNMGYNARMPITPRQFQVGLDNFARLSRGGYDDRKPMPGIKEALKAIQDAGIRVEIWTYAPGATDHNPDTLAANGTGAAQKETMDLIERLGILENPRKQVLFVKPHEKAVEMAKEHIPLIVEDHPLTAVHAGTIYGNAAILVPEPYNVNVSVPGVLRLDNRADLAPAVIDFFKKLEEAGCLLSNGR